MPVEPWIVVVAETPSLGHSITDLLESDGQHVAMLLDAGRALTRRLKDVVRPVGLVVSASNGFACDTVQRWTRGEVAGVDLVVVGSRDPTLRPGPHVHIVQLPLAPDGFLGLVRSLLGRAGVPVVRSRRHTAATSLAAIGA